MYASFGFGGQCTASTRAALERIGFLDTRFHGYGWEHVEWTHRFRLYYQTSWNLPIGSVPCLGENTVQIDWSTSAWSDVEMDANWQVYAELMTGPLYTPPFRSVEQQFVLEAEVSSAVCGGRTV